MAHARSNHTHAKAVIPHLREAVDAKGQRYKYHAGNRALVGPDTIIIRHGAPPLRAHQHMAQGGLPPEVMDQAANRHPGDIAAELAHVAHKELPLASAGPKGAPMPPAPMGGGQLPMAGR